MKNIDEPRNLQLVRVGIEGVAMGEAYIEPGENWNGWAVPFFTKAQADALQAKGVYEWLQYDDFADAYVSQMTGSAGETESWSPVTLNGKIYYPIGSGCWIWEVMGI